MAVVRASVRGLLANFPKDKTYSQSMREVVRLRDAPLMLLSYFFSLFFGYTIHLRVLF